MSERDEANKRNEANEPGPGGDRSPVDEPSGAQGTGGTGQPVSDEPGATMPKPTEHPGRVRRRAEPEPAGGADGEPAGGPVPQAPVGWLPRGAEEVFGPGATAELAYELLTVDVPAERWIAALETARDELGCTYFDWLSAVDEPGTGFRVCAHVVALPAEPGACVRRLVVRATVAHEAPVLPTATGVYAGAAWHERETHEMFGIGFTDHPHLAPLLLPDGFEGNPLRKDFVLAARVAKAWPGAKEPGESGHGGPKRRQMLPPGVPDPNEWGPMKGQLPPAPSRPARGRAAAGGDRPARRTRSASAGSASQRSANTESAADTPRPPRRARSASEGSASQRPAPPPEEGAGGGTPSGAPRPPRPPRRARSASEGSASQRDVAPGEGEAQDGAPPGGPRSADAPWHHARPAFDEAGGGEEPAAEEEPRAPRDGEPRDGEPCDGEPCDGGTGGER